MDLAITASRAEPHCERNAFRIRVTMDSPAEYQAAHANSLHIDFVRSHFAGSRGNRRSNLTRGRFATWYATTLIDRPTFRSHAYQLLHAILGTAVKDGLLQSNPCQIDGASATKRVSQSVILEIDELASVAELIEPQRFKALILISAWCGLRWGEVTELRRKDIGEGAEIISIARGVTHRTGKQAGTNGSRCMIDTPKSGKPRTVVVPPHIRADIKHHLDTHVDSDEQSSIPVDRDLLCGLLGSGGVVGPFDEFAVLELRAGADERHEMGRVDRPPA